MSKNYDSHFWLYAKHHYKKSDDTLADLKKLVSHRCGIDEKYLGFTDVLSVLIDIAYPFIMKNSQQFKTFLDNLCRFSSTNYPFWSYDSVKITPNAMLDSIVSMMSIVQVKDVEKGIVFIELDEPDYSILPKPDTEGK